MVFVKVLRAFQKVIILYLTAVLAVKVVPCNVHGIPDTVLHFDIIPHMSGLFFFVKITENAYTRDVKPVTYEFECFGISLANNSRFNKSTKC